MDKRKIKKLGGRGGSPAKNAWGFWEGNLARKGGLSKKTEKNIIPWWMIKDNGFDVEWETSYALL